MGYGSRCPTCLRPWQRGSGIVSSFSSIAKRAMARELGRKMAAATLAIQRYGNPRSKQQGSGLVKTILSSKPVRTVGKAVVEALAGKAVEALTSPKEKKRRQKPRRRRNPQSKKRRKPPIQTGSGLPLLALMASAAPLIGKSAGLGALGALVNHGVQKALGS